MPSYHRDPAAPEPNTGRKVGVCFIVELDDRVLIDRRRDDDQWAFTGGTVEDGESVLAALARELSEETGLTGTPRFLGVFSDPSRIVHYPDGAVVRLLSLAFVVTAEPGRVPLLSEESNELRLVTRSELGELAFWPAHLPMRDAYLSWDGRPVIA